MSDQMELTEKDYELLLESLDAWEQKPRNDDFQVLVAKSILTPRGSREEQAVESERLLAAADAKVKSRRQMTIILRAKLELARQAAQRAGIEAAQGVKQ